MDEAEKFSQIRFFSVGQVQSVTPLVDVSNIEIHWSVPNKGSLGITLNLLLNTLSLF